VGAGVGVPLATGEVRTVGAVVVVVVAGDMVVPGDMPGTVAETPGAAGDVPGAVTGEVSGAVAGEVTGAVAGEIAVAGLVAVVGGAPGGLAGLVAGDVWPNEVSASVTVKRLAISCVFIGLIRKLSRPGIPMSWVSS
jgi:hypothetical protein